MQEQAMSDEQEKRRLREHWRVVAEELGMEIEPEPEEEETPYEPPAAATTPEPEPEEEEVSEEREPYAQEVSEQPEPYAEEVSEEPELPWRSAERDEPEVEAHADVEVSITELGDLPEEARHEAAGEEEEQRPERQRRGRRRGRRGRRGRDREDRPTERADRPERAPVAERADEEEVVEAAATEVSAAPDEAVETGRESSREEKGRRRRRRGRGKDRRGRERADAAEAAAPEGDEGGGAEQSEPREFGEWLTEEGEEVAARADRAEETARRSADLDADEDQSAEGPGAETDGDDYDIMDEEDPYADWNIPSWQELIASLYRPER
jgi:hypothetical protein